MLGLSQAKLAAMAGLTAGQVDSLERGVVHLTARQLYDFSRLLNVPIAFLFEDMPGDGDRRAASPAGSFRSVADRQRRLGSVLRLLLTVVELADCEGGIKQEHYEAAKKRARAALAMLPSHSRAAANLRGCEGPLPAFDRPLFTVR
jgi:transcriptional regulator with XRE-family HTH domain